MKKEVLAELEAIAANAADGHLHATEIVARARSAKSPLHPHFTWEDGKAADMWRLEEARGLIRSYHVIVQQEPMVRTRAFVSLRADRARGGGYVSINRILSDRELHQQMLDDALRELAEVEARYSHLSALQPVFTALRRVRRRTQRDFAATA